MFPSTYKYDRKLLLVIVRKKRKANRSPRLAFPKTKIRRKLSVLKFQIKILEVSEI